MAIKTGQGGEMQIVLRVKDDGTAVIEKFGKTAEDKAEGISTGWKKVGLAIGAAAVVAATTAVAMVKSAIDTADATGKMAEKLGTTAEAISALNYAASLSNVSAQELGNSLQFMNRNLSDAAKGTGDARFAIKDLGLSAKELKDLKPEEAMLKIAEALEKIPSQADRAAIAADIFNDRTGKMLNVLKGGPAVIRATMAEAERFGQIISTDTAKAAEQFNDNVTRLKANLTGMANSIMQSVVPALVSMTNAMLGVDRVSALGNNVEALRKLHTDLNIAGAELHKLADLQQERFGRVEPGLLARIHRVDEEINRVNNKLAAVATTAAAASAGAGAGGGGGAINSRAVEEQAKQVADQLKQLQDRTAGDAENRARQYVKDYQTLQQALNLKLIAQEQFQQQSTALADQYEQALAEIALQDPAFQAGEKLAQALESERAARQTGLQNRTADVLASLQTDQQIEDDRYAQQLATLAEANQTIIAATEEANARKLLEDDAYRQATQQAEIQHKARMGDIHAQAQLEGLKFQKLTDAQKIQSILATGTQMTASVANSSKSMFAVNKAFALANAAVALPDAVIQSFEKGGGYPWGLIPAGLMLATGLANIAQIKAAQFGSSTSAPSIAGGAATPTFSAGSNFGPAQTPAPSVASAPATIINVTVQGNILGNREFVNETLIPELRQAINSRDITIIDANSRQSIELRS